jgi:tetratricopeptide (TPR) repeat protein
MERAIRKTSKIMKFSKHLTLSILLLHAMCAPFSASGQETGNHVSDDIDIQDHILPGHYDEFSRANRLYTEGSFKEAILIYHQIINSGYHSAELYYNLGNAYYRSGQVPAAILNYERAALLAPGDEDIRFNLLLARTNVRDRIEELPDFFLNRWWKGARDMLGAGEWAAVSVVSFTVSLVFLAVFLMSFSVVVKKIFFWLAVTVFFWAIMSFSFGLDQRNHLKNQNTAIVFSPVVPVKSSPDINSTDLFFIHEGTKVWVEDSLGDWRAIRLSDGNKGWLQKMAIEMI